MCAILGYSKLAQWEDRMAVVGRRVRVSTARQAFYRFKGRVAERVRVDGKVCGRDWVRENWGGLDRIFTN